jgi:hypothetical protein
MTTPPTPFALVLRNHLTHWGTQHFEHGWTDGEHGWVLDKALAHRNLFDPAWTAYVEGRRHRWFHALNSSQAFAVNLFAPLAAHPALAVDVWCELVPHGSAVPPERVEVRFERDSRDLGCAEMLGESRRPTQVDVVLEATWPGRASAFVLVEVKLAETGFGACRGPSDPTRNPTVHPCHDFTAVQANPDERCWLAALEGRRYWALMAAPGGFAPAGDERGRCPFQGGLYQLLRGWALAAALRQRGHAASVGACVHPRNTAVGQLPVPIAGRGEVTAAYDALAEEHLVRVDPGALVARCAPVQGADWADYMRERYLLA